MTNWDREFMSLAIDLAVKSMRNNEGGPFGAIVIRDNEVIGRGNNCVTSTNDPTGHAEIVALRQACNRLGNFRLDNCTIYSSCEPCPMCLGAIHWARVSRVYYACTRLDAARTGFDDNFIYEELSVPLAERGIPMEQLLRVDALKVFDEWMAKPDRLAY